jgi:hypothetical protein
MAEALRNWIVIVQKAKLLLERQIYLTLLQNSRLDWSSIDPLREIISKSAAQRGVLIQPINPKSPRILPNTSTTRTLTNKSGSAASAIAALAPVIPTQRPHSRLHEPTVRPPQKRAYPVK